MEIPNITISEYFELEDRSTYDYIIKYSQQSKDHFELGDITQLPFGNVKDIQYKYSQGATLKDVIEFIGKEKNLELKEIGKHRIIDLVRENNYLLKQIEYINNIEENGLLSPTDPVHEEANVKRFNVFGYMIQVDKLAGGDITKYEQVMSMTYIDCFTKLRLEKERDEFNADVIKIQSRKNGKI